MSGLDEVIGELDRLHREDPAGKELDYANRMTRWLSTLDASPDPLLMIAVRAQHLQRWVCPRGEYPAGRIGYLAWRRHAADHHAGLVADVLRRVGYEDAAVDRVVGMVKKRGLGRDPHVQTLEDCACLVFLETELRTFSEKHPAANVDDVLRKTWRKMSPEAQKLAGAFVASPPVA